MSDLSDVTGVSPLREDQVNSFWDKGYLKVDSLISPSFARMLLDSAKSLVRGYQIATQGEGSNEDAAMASTNKGEYRSAMWKDLPDPSPDDKEIWDFTHSSGLGLVASQLLTRPGPVRFFRNQLLVKMPSAEKGAGTPWHQDFPYLAIDRTERPSIWIALDEIPPERGSLRFVDGSHRLGSLGRMFEHAGEDLSTRYPEIFRRHRLSPEFDLKAGDALIFHPLTFHAAPPNDTDEPRWVLLVQFIDADTRYTGASPATVRGLTQVGVGETIDRPEFPIVQTGAGIRAA